MSSPPQLAPVVTVQQFRTDWPEFANATSFPDAAVNFWLTVAQLLLPPQRWLGILTLGIELFIAHNMILESRALATVNVFGLPGISKGAINSETPGDITVSYDTATTLEEGAGHWNLTEYGTRLKRLFSLVGAGPVQVSPSGCPGPNSGTPWSGPPTIFGIF